MTWFRVADLMQKVRGSDLITLLGRGWGLRRLGRRSPNGKVAIQVNPVAGRINDRRSHEDVEVLFEGCLGLRPEQLSEDREIRKKRNQIGRAHV